MLCGVWLFCFVVVFSILSSADVGFWCCVCGWVCDVVWFYVLCWISVCALLVLSLCVLWFLVFARVCRFCCGLLMDLLVLVSLCVVCCLVVFFVDAVSMFVSC